MDVARLWLDGPANVFHVKGRMDENVQDINLPVQPSLPPCSPFLSPANLPPSMRCLITSPVPFFLSVPPSLYPSWEHTMLSPAIQLLPHPTFFITCS